MAGGARSIVIRFLGNTQGLNAQMTAAQRRMHSFRRSVAAASAGAVAGLAVIGKQAIDTASDTAEATSKVQNVFGAWATSINDFAATSATSFGISKREALGFTSAMGSVLVAQGFTQQSAAALSTQYTQLSADLASFNNTSITEAAEALQASLTGEFEQLKKYGIVINDVRLNQEAARVGMEKAGATFTQSQKNQLAYNIVMHDTALAQGDFARTSDGLANQQRILSAQVDDLQGRLGEKLLPAALSLVAAFNDFATWVGHNESTVKLLAAAVGGLWLVVVGVAAAQRVAAAATAIWTGAMWLLNAAFLGNPIGLVVLAVAALAAGFVFAWKKSETFRNIVIGAFNTIVGAVGTAVKALVSYYAWWVDLALLGFQKLLEGLGHLPDWLGGGKADQAAAAIANLRANISAAVDHINSEIDRVTKTVQIDVNIVTNYLDAKDVGQRAALSNEFNAEKQQRLQAKRAPAAPKAPAVPKISFPSTSVAPQSTGGGAAQKAKVVKEAKKTGQEILDAFLSGLSSRFPAVEDSLRKWSDKLPAKLGHGLDKVVADAEKRLARMAKAVDANSDALDKAQDRLTDAKDRLRDYAKEVRGAVNALGDLGSHGGGTFEIVRDRLRQTLVNAKDFAATMRRLSAAGLSDTAVQQLVAAGPGLATQTGKAILAGGRAGIAEINRLQTELDRVAKATATATANELFAAGVRQAEGVLAGLKSKQKVLEAQMRKAGDALVDAVLQGLKLKVTGAGVRIAGKRALGGPVTAGRSYLVGEQGMELFTPRTSGAITPLGGDGGSMSVNIYATGPTLQDIVRVEVRENNRRLKTASLAGARRTV